MLYGSHTGVEEQVAAGDAGVDGALADIDGDVSRAQEEQLDSVASSRRTSSRPVRRVRYPASVSMVMAGSDRDPLLGTAMRSTVILRSLILAGGDDVESNPAQRY